MMRQEWRIFLFVFVHSIKGRGEVYVPNSFFIWWNEKKKIICDLEWESKSIRINGLFLCLQDVVDENVVCGEF